MNLLKILLDRLKRLDPLKYSRDLGVKIGSGTRILSLPNWGSEPYLISIGNHVTITSGVKFITHDGGTWVIRIHEKYENVIKYGRITVGDNCFIGIDSIIMPGVSIGDNCVIAAGSVVTKDVPAGSVWGGVPARHICTIEEYGERCLALTPDYDIQNYQRNKKEELLRILK